MPITHAGQAPGAIFGLIQLNVRIKEDAKSGPAVEVTFGRYVDGLRLAEARAVSIAVK